MNDEIKEILERVKKHYVLDEIQDNLLLDYITNLQQENERLKLERHQLKQKLEAKNKRIKMIKDILNGRSDE